MDVGPAELLIVLVIALVLFGGKKIPDLARSLGQAKNEFEKGVRGEQPGDEPAPVLEPESVDEVLLPAEPEPVTAVASRPADEAAASS
ncbi:MAG: Sec-independent protein translocase subunit TatA/TatB [Aquihabitans sp.]